MERTLPVEWKTLLQSEFERPYFSELDRALTHAYHTRIIYPPKSHIFSAFSHCSLAKTRVVILGQDPYHGPDQAHGLAFSVPNNTPLPPSLRNIYQELHNDMGCVRQTGDLSDWATQGVLLLNTTLTVEAGVAGSHTGWGWEYFTDAVISLISKEKTGVIFVLWGKHAQEKGKLIDTSKHHIIASAHPSPLSAYRGFFGSKHFSHINNLLLKANQPPITWC